MSDEDKPPEPEEWVTGFVPPMVKRVGKLADYLVSENPEDRVIAGILRRLSLSEDEFAALSRHLKGPARKSKQELYLEYQPYIREYTRRVVNGESKTAVSKELGQAMHAMGLAISAEAGAKTLRGKVPKVSHAKSSSKPPPR